MQKGGGIAAIFCAVLIALQAAVAVLNNQPFGLSGATQAVSGGQTGIGSLFASETLRMVLGAFLLLLVSAASARSGARAKAKGQTNWVSVIGLVAAVLVCVSGACSVYLLMDAPIDPAAAASSSSDLIATFAQFLFGIALFLLTIWQLLLGFNSLLNRSFPGLVSLLAIASAVLSVISILIPDLLIIGLLLTLCWLVATGLAMLATRDPIVPAAPPLLITAPRNQKRSN